MNNYNYSKIDKINDNMPKEKFQLIFRLENLPGVGTTQMVAGECMSINAVSAGKTLEVHLQNRIGTTKYKHLAEAKIVDSNGKDRAFLQIDKSCGIASGHVTYTPFWGRWLNVF